ncbi:hypothetical protein M8C21_006539, partial [Ambrosia artemisiifolia]
INNNNNNIHQTTTLCLLNQSPWDIISFPSSPSSPTSIHLFDDYVTCYNVNAAAHWSSPDSTTPIQSVYDGDMDVDEDKNRAESDTTTSAMMRTVWSCQVAPGKGDFDYMGEYEECDDGKQEKTVKKKWRKPMKARSLK